MSERTRAHVHVTGKVQGVYFRATTRDETVEVTYDDPRGEEDFRVRW
jgi:acylphosphatase